MQGSFLRQGGLRTRVSAQVLEVLAYIEAAVSLSPGAPQCLLLCRDALLLSILWATGGRCLTIGSFRLDNVRLPTGV